MLRKKNALSPDRAQEFAEDITSAYEPIIRELLLLAEQEIDPFLVGVDREYTDSLTSLQKRLIKRISYHRSGEVAAVDFRTRDEILSSLREMTTMAKSMTKERRKVRGARLELRDSPSKPSKISAKLNEVLKNV